MSRIGLKLCFLSLAGCVFYTRVRAAEEEAKRDLPPNGNLFAAATQTAWCDPSNFIRPYKGLRTLVSGRQVATLTWVLTNRQGQPLAVCGYGSDRVDLYFDRRLEVKLEQIAQRHSLTTLQTDKLRLAAQVDLARLQRLAQHVDGVLSEPRPGQDASEVNRLFDALAVACDQQLFEAESLLRRVLVTQLQNPSHPAPLSPEYRGEGE